MMTTPILHPWQVASARAWWLAAAVVRVVRSATLPAFIVWFTWHPLQDDFAIWFGPLACGVTLISLGFITYHLERKAWDCVPGTYRSYRSLDELWGQLPTRAPDRIVMILALTIQTTGLVYAGSLYELVGQIIHSFAVALLALSAWRGVSATLVSSHVDPRSRWIKTLAAVWPSLPFNALIFAFTPQAPAQMVACACSLTLATQVVAWMFDKGATPSTPGPRYIPHFPKAVCEPSKPASSSH